MQFRVNQQNFTINILLTGSRKLLKTRYLARRFISYVRNVSVGRLRILLYSCQYAQAIQPYHSNVLFKEVQEQLLDQLTGLVNNLRDRSFRGHGSRSWRGLGDTVGSKLGERVGVYESKQHVSYTMRGRQQSVLAREKSRQNRGSSERNLGSERENL